MTPTGVTSGGIFSRARSVSKSFEPAKAVTNPSSRAASKAITTTLPGKATLLSPSGSIAGTTPTYTWNEVPGATWYYVWVDGASGPGIVKQWYSSTQANCNGTTYSATPVTALSSGTYTWYVQTWNS